MIKYFSFDDCKLQILKIKVLKKRRRTIHNTHKSVVTKTTATQYDIDNNKKSSIYEKLLFRDVFLKEDTSDISNKKHVPISECPESTTVNTSLQEFLILEEKAKRNSPSNAGDFEIEAVDQRPMYQIFNNELDYTCEVNNIHNIGFGDGDNRDIHTLFQKGLSKTENEFIKLVFTNIIKAFSKVTGHKKSVTPNLGQSMVSSALEKTLSIEKPKKKPLFKNLMSYLAIKSKAPNDIPPARENIYQDNVSFSSYNISTYFAVSS